MAGKQGFLVVSDLHLSEGRNPKTGWIDPREDFLFDDDFADFLEFHTCSEEWADTEWTLVIAGDFVDFLQVTEMPPNQPGLEREGDYGLVAGPAESAWKIRRIMLGHPALFHALAKFCLEHRIVLISGNHDAEFFYPEVREALISGLLELRTPPRGNPGPSERLSFFPWFFFDGNVYIEHGHQYDPTNSFPSALAPLEKPSKKTSGEFSGKMFLPLGSIFVRYLFNRVETSSPFADNIKPETRFIGWFIRNHPLRALLFLVTDGRKMLYKIRESLRSSGSPGATMISAPDPGNPADYCLGRAAADSDTRPGTERESDEISPLPRGKKEWHRRIRLLERIQSQPLLSPAIKPSARLLLFMLVPEWIISLLLGLVLLNLAAVVLLFSPFWSLSLPTQFPGLPVIQEIVDWNRNSQIPLITILSQLVVGILFYFKIIRRIKEKCCSRILKEKGAAIDEILHPEYIVMGHCHEPDLVRFPSGCQYINTGTWTKIFSYESSAAREEKEFIYTRIITEGGKRKMDIMKWEGRGGTGRRANLIDD